MKVKTARIILIITSLVCLSLLFSGCDSNKEHLCYSEREPQHTESRAPTCRENGIIRQHYICDRCDNPFYFGERARRSQREALGNARATLHHYA